MMVSICEGLTILEFGTGMANSIATMILADNGARVLKVEPPGGDPLRREFQTAFLVWNRGKESIVLDLHTAGGQKEAQRLAKSVDVLVEAFAAGTADRFRIGYDALRQSNPGLVYCAIKGFGSKGPYAHLKAYDAIISAKAGIYGYGVNGGAATGGGGGRFRPGPIFMNVPRAAYGAGLLGVQGILAALMVRDQTGRGQYVESTLFHGLNPYTQNGLLNLYPGQSGMPTPAAGGARPGGGLGGGFFCTKDGRWVQFTALLPHQFRAIFRAFGLEYIWEDPQFKSFPAFPDSQTAEAFRDLLFTRFRERTLAEWMPILLNEDDIAFEVGLSSGEALEHPQTLHNKGWVEIDDPGVGKMRQIGPIGAFSETPSVIRNPAPALGQHQALNGHTNGHGAAKESGKPPPPHPLHGVTIIDFTQFYAAPFGIALAGSLGARVIKVEDLSGDPWRMSSPGGTAKTTEGKESIALNLRTPEARKVLHQLVAKADILVYGLRPGKEAQVGVDYETLEKINPRLTYIFAGGYGITGPYSQRAMYGNTTTLMLGRLYRHPAKWLDPALAQSQNLEGLKDLANRILAVGTNGDPDGALGCATVLLLSIFSQHRTNSGQFVDAPFITRSNYVGADDFNSYVGKPPLPMPDPECYGLHALYRLYESQKGWVFLACPKQKEWEAFCAATGQGSLAHDRRFATPEARKEHDGELVAVLTTFFKGGPAADWERQLAPKGVGCVEVFEGSTSEFCSTDPVAFEMGLAAKVVHPKFGEHVRFGLPIAFSETPGRLAPGCMVGQHTDAILEEFGYDQDTVRRFKGDKVVASSA